MRFDFHRNVIFEIVYGDLCIVDSFIALSNVMLCYVLLAIVKKEVIKNDENVVIQFVIKFTTFLSLLISVLCISFFNQKFFFPLLFF